MNRSQIDTLAKTLPRAQVLDHALCALTARGQKLIAGPLPSRRPAGEDNSLRAATQESNFIQIQRHTHFMDGQRRKPPKRTSQITGCSERPKQ